MWPIVPNLAPVVASGGWLWAVGAATVWVRHTHTRYMRGEFAYVAGMTDGIKRDYLRGPAMV